MQPSDRALEEAAEWLVRADSGDDLGGCFEEELVLWRQQKPENERAWQAACKLRAMLGDVPERLGSSTLGRQRMDRRSLLKSLAVLTAVPVAGWFGYAGLPWESWQADIRTAKGEQRTIPLPDGSELLLNTDTAVDISYSENARTLKLHHGEICVTTAPAPSSHERPFVVETEQGRVRALGTQFIVRTFTPGYRQGNGQTSVTVIRQAVAIRPKNKSQETTINADRQAMFSAQKVFASELALSNAKAWVSGQLIADDQRLDKFLRDLERYRPGVLRVDPAVADLRISGVFQLANTDQVLEILARTLPVRIQKLTDYWVTVVAA